MKTGKSTQRIIVAATLLLGVAVSLPARASDVSAPVTEFTSETVARMQVLSSRPDVDAALTLHGISTDDAAGIKTINVRFEPAGAAALPLRDRRGVVTADCGDILPALECTWTSTAPTVPGAYIVYAWAVDEAYNVEGQGTGMVVVVV